MFYRLCVHSNCNIIDFQCMKNIREHLTAEIVALYILSRRQQYYCCAWYL